MNTIDQENAKFVADNPQYGYSGQPNPTVLPDASQPTTEPAPVEKSPVSTINTDSAVSNLNNQNNFLNTTYPPQTDTTKETPKADTTTPSPKAYFANTLGQEAEFTQEQLNDPKNQSFLSSNGYIQTRTEGPKYDTGAGSKAQEDLNGIDTQINTAINDVKTYSALNDPDFIEYQRNLERNLKTASDLTMQVGRDNARAFVAALGGRARSGSAMKAGGNFIAEAGQKIAELGQKEADAVLQAKLSLKDRKYSEFNTTVNNLRAIRTEKAQALQDYNKVIVDYNKEIQKKLEEQNKIKIQSTRDSAIADLVSQGITDPNEILGLLNESAKASGYNSSDFTADEIGKALKVFNPDSALAGLNADYKTYSYLTKIKDPSVAGMSYFDYQKAVSNAQRKASGQDDITLSGDKKTKLLGSGLSQNDIVNIENDVRTHGLDKVLESVTDGNQKKAIQDAYGVKEKVTRAQLETTVNQKMAQDGLKEAYTTQELKDLADKYGISGWFTGEAGDIENFLNSSDAKKVYIDLLYKQYENAGMAQK